MNFASPDTKSDTKLDHPEEMNAYTFMDVIRRSRETLERALAEYEATGDHNHGGGPKAPGAPCGGGDCNVTRVRNAIKALM